MDSFLQPLRDLPPRARRWSLVLVLLCGGVLGYFVFRTCASPLHMQYQLDFGAAQWIEPAEFAPVAYFRKEIFLNTAPEQAWLEIAATDSFVLIGIPTQVLRSFLFTAAIKNLVVKPAH
ncbi:MAG: hypothetical protein DMF19_14265 [Verrucomicrobia bacterium]|nr:MAG: hypothetical protein DMF19_14265 [Verrucomicrobiota bacterium]